MGRSQRLIDALESEGKRWKQSFYDFSEKLENLMGNIILTSAIISYLGPFDCITRIKTIEQW